MVDYNKSGTLPVSATFTAEVDELNPLTTHIWKVDNVIDPDATTNVFTKSFNEYKTYTIEHSGSNICSSGCTPVTKTISITASPEQPIPLELVAGVVIVGILGVIYIIIQKKK